MAADGLQAGIDKLRAAGAADHTLVAFARYHDRLRAGDRGMLAESDIEPVAWVPDLDGDGMADRPIDQAGLDPRHAEGGRDPGAEPDHDRALLDQVVVVKLNGGLATTMAAGAGKGLLEVKPGLTFVDLAVHQIHHLRRRTGCRLPLLLLTSSANEGATRRALARRIPPGSAPVLFTQAPWPRLRTDDLHPVSWPDDPALEWAPAGHGEVYVALAASGQLRQLLGDGIRYAVVGSIDNVAAQVDSRIPAAMAAASAPFLMEVADRTPVDRKGGHLAQRRDGSLVLRELAQTPAEDRERFHDVERHRYFNTNTVWIDLEALDRLLGDEIHPPDLPLIANRKRLDPYDPSSPEVLQIETAMGAAISVFPQAAARRVDRSGFNPVRSTAELLAARSDAYRLTDEHRLVLAPERGGLAPVVELDPVHFSRQRDFEARFPAGPPSLVDCERLTVRGDVVFGAGVRVRGSVTVEADGPGPRLIADGTRLGGG